MISAEKRLELLKVIAHPARIKILADLVQGVKCVSDFEDSLNISPPDVYPASRASSRERYFDFYVRGERTMLIRLYFNDPQGGR